MTITQYRVLLTASVVIGILAGVIDYIFPEMLGEDFRNAQLIQDESFSFARIAVLAGLGIALLVLLVSSTYGLYKFRSWAPKLAIVATVLTMVLVVVAGAFAQSGLALALTYLSSYLWGVVLFAAYYGPISDHFRHRT